MTDGPTNEARVKLVASYEGGALFVAAFADGAVEIRECERDDPSAVRGLVPVRPEFLEALVGALREASGLTTAA